MSESLSTLELLKSNDYNPQPLNENAVLTRLDTQTLDKSLSRHATNLSEISRIISGIRDDRELDHEQEYKAHFEAEESLMRRLSLVSGAANDGEKSDLDETTDEACDSDHPIDGRFAFWQAFLVMLMTLSTWGTNAAFGVFLNYYLSADYFPGASKYDFALMGGLVVFLAQMLAPFTALSVRVLGQTPVHLAGICLQTLGYLLAAQCTQLWQIFLCQGMLVGISFSLIFIPGTLVLATWFEKQKALAMGIAVSGAGLGGLIYSLALNKIIQQTGDQKWALRTAGLINLAVSLFGTAFIRARNSKKVNYRETFSWQFIRSSVHVVVKPSVFYDLRMLLLGIWFGVVLLAYVIVLYSFAAVATSVGLSHTDASSILSVLNALQVVGRPLMGTLGDSFGRTNAAMVVCAYLGVLCTAYWINARSYAALMVLAGIMGGFTGVGSTMVQSIASDVLKFQGHPEDLPAAWGGLNIIVSLFALPAEVIALKLQTKSGVHQYRHAQIFAGCCFFAGVLLLVANREWLVKQTFLARRAAALELLKTLETPEETAVLEARVERYNHLLQDGPGKFVARTFYPIRV